MFSWLRSTSTFAKATARQVVGNCFKFLYIKSVSLSKIEDKCVSESKFLGGLWLPTFRFIFLEII